MKVFISHPMRGKDPDRIKRERECLIDQVKTRLGTDNFEVVDSYFEDYDPQSGDDNVNAPLSYLGESIKLLATANVAAFAPDWCEARGCRIEHICAMEYGLVVMELDF